jgi:membrane protease YdiL (CAAX protease family)
MIKIRKTGGYMGRNITDLEHDRFGLKTIFFVIMGLALFIASALLASLPFDLIYSIYHKLSQEKASLLLSLLRIIGQPVLNVVMLLLLTYLCIVKILKRPLAGFRICKPKKAAIWILCAIALPLLVSGFFLLTPGTFSINGRGFEQTILLILRAVFDTCLVAGITEEVIFRGFIMHLLEIRWNKYIAIIVPSFIFGVLHILNMDNPNMVDVVMLLIAGTCVGVMFSLISYQSGSIWPSAIVHGIWNLIIIGGIFEISNEPARSLFNYTIHSNSTLITGGAFGIEASVPAVIGYGIVIILAIVLQRKKAKS